MFYNLMSMLNKLLKNYQKNPSLQEQKFGALPEIVLLLVTESHVSQLDIPEDEHVVHV